MASTTEHISRLANRSTDHLGKMGAEQVEELVVCDKSPPLVCQFVFEDAMGVGELRD